MKNSIKRAQSQARLSFAERENFRPKVKQLKKTLLTLVALLALTTGAWATTVTWVTEDFYNTSPVTFTKDDVTVTTTNNARMSNFFYGDGVNTFTTTLGNFTKIEIVFMPESSPVNISGWDYEVIEAVQPFPDDMPEIVEYTSKLTWTGDAESVSIQGLVMNIKSITFTIATSVPLNWDKATKTGTFTQPAGNVAVSVEYFPQATLTEAPTAINDVPATTDGAIVKAGTVANIGSTETAQGTVMYYVSQTALDDDALLALAADQWTADVPTAESLAEGQAYVYYYVRGNDSDTDEENFSDGDILAANALTVTIAAEPTYAVTFADGVNPEPPADPEWTATPNADVKKGQTVTVTYTGDRKVIGVKAEKKAAAAAVEGHALSASVVGEIVGSDGKAYAVADKDNLPSGVTAVAMVAYRSETVGNSLAIQLNASPVQKDWSEAKTYAEGLTAVSGGTWHLPSKTDWQNMFVGCAVSGDAGASNSMNPIAGFKAKIAATGTAWDSGIFKSSTAGSGSKAWGVLVNLDGSSATADFYEFVTSNTGRVLGCLAF